MYLSTVFVHCITCSSLSKWKKIRLLRSCPVTLSKVELSERYAVPIRLLSYVGVLPYFRLTKGKKIPADRICSRIQVSVITIDDLKTPLLSIWTPLLLILITSIIMNSIPINAPQVSFYGPGNIVLFPIGTESSFDVRDIVNWSDYRIFIGEKIEPLGSQGNKL